MKMGSIFGKQIMMMDDNLKKQQLFMLESQRLQMERQLQMQNIMREKMMALQVAKSRDLLYFVGGATILAYMNGANQYLKHKNRLALIPCFPLTIVCLYLIDSGYGSKLKRMKNTAEILLHNHPELFDLPLGPVTMEEIEMRRLENSGKSSE